MATFQPLDFDFGLGGGDNLGFGYQQAPLAMGGSLSPAGGNSAGWFQNLFGDSAGGGLFSGDGVFTKNSMFGGTNRNTGISSAGWAPIALGLGQALFGAVQGRQAMSLAKDQFKESKRQFDLNFEANRKTTNTALEDRQRARVASNPTAYEAVDSYLDRNRV